MRRKTRGRFLKRDQWAFGAECPVPKGCVWLVCAVICISRHPCTPETTFSGQFSFAGVSFYRVAKVVCFLRLVLGATQSFNVYLRSTRSLTADENVKQFVRLVYQMTRLTCKNSEYLLFAASLSLSPGGPVSRTYRHHQGTSIQLIFFILLLASGDIGGW